MTTSYKLGAYGRAVVDRKKDGVVFLHLYGGGEKLIMTRMYLTMSEARSALCQLT
jgi:hypothetical protein